jgi:short subunit dehydrogenase-like uncharacterized protein
MPHFLIYGANGYTGSLIARAVVARGYQPSAAVEMNCFPQGLAPIQPLATRSLVRNRKTRVREEP